MHELTSTLQSSLPPRAHEYRLRRVLNLWPHAADSAPALSLLMQGALGCNALSLQLELLDRFRSIPAASATSAGLLGLVQLPLLRRLGASEALPWSGLDEHLDEHVLRVGGSSHEGMQETECFLAAAALARRGDVLGPKHGCVIVAPSRAGDAFEG